MLYQLKNDANYDSKDDLDVLTFAILTVYIVHYVCQIKFACFKAFDAEIISDKRKSDQENAKKD